MRLFPVFALKYMALHIGYDIQTDLPMGITVAFGHRKNIAPDGVYLGGPRYRFVASFHFDRPMVTYRDSDWVVGDEEGYVRGMPVRRPGIPASAWTGRRYTVREVSWPRCGYVARYA